jgi:tetratricopeptide (TPR) repeat protein
MNRLPEALSVLNAALKKNPNDLDALLQRGELALGAGQYQDGEADLNRVLHLRTGAPEVHYALAKLHQARGATLRQREELSETLRLNPSLLQVRLELATSMIRENAGKAALAVLDGAPQNQKSLVAIVEQRNWALLSAGQLAEARKGVEQGLASTRTPDLLMQDAILKISERRYGEARTTLHEAMAENREDLRLLQLLVRSYAAQNQVPTAVNELRAYALKNPKSAAIQYFWGRLLFETGAPDQAEQAFTAAKALDPNYAPANLSLAHVELTQGDWRDARQELTGILSKKGAEDPSARNSLGMLEFSVGNQNAAIVDFRKVIEVQPNNAVALNNLAYLLAENGQAEEALKYAEKAVELAPDKSSFQDTLGWVLYRKGLYNAAVSHLQSAVSKGGDVRWQYHLAIAYFKSGSIDRGRAVLQSALRKDSNLPEAKIAQQMSQETVPAQRAAGKSQ